MISSPSNKRVAKAVRLKKRALREKDRRFLVEGVPAVQEAVTGGATVHVVFHAGPGDSRVGGVLERARLAGVPVVELSEDLMGRLTSTVTPQGIVAVADFVDVPLESVPHHGGCVAVLAEVRDPGNAGTIVRSADAAGADGVVFTVASVDVYNEKAVRASAGSLFHVPIVRGAGLTEAVAALRAAGMQVLAASAGGTMSMYEADLARPTAVVFGNEAHGLSAESLELADATIRVPIHGRAESLNLAAATALVLFESARQRSAGDGLAGLIGRAAHDIRSPLASLLGFTHTLRARWESLDDDQKRAMVDTMDYDARRMRSLVAQLVDAARLSTGSLGLMLEPVELLEAARKAATEANHPEIPPVEVSGEAVTVVADRKRLATVLDALIEACRWWGEQGPVTISVRAAPHAALEVSRRGSRLDPAEAQDAFAPRTSGTGGGSKVGLFVARGLADAHGASLTVDGGVAVRFTLAFPSA